MARFLILLLALLAFAAPARADDISAAGRGVVRVVVVVIEDGEIVDFGHGSGFAVASNRIVTNAHVIEGGRRFTVQNLTVTNSSVRESPCGTNTTFRNITRVNTSQSVC